MAHRRPLRSKDRALPPLRFVDRATAIAGLALRAFAGAHGGALGSRPGAPLRLRSLANPSSDVASALSPPRGRNAKANRAPAGPLERWTFEGSPACRPVREVLWELEIPYLLRTLARGSPKRRIFRERWGQVAIPFLHHLHGGVSTFGTDALIEHLERTYGSVS